MKSMACLQTLLASALTAKRKRRRAKGEVRTSSKTYGTNETMTDEELDFERLLTSYLQMQRDIFAICAKHNGSVTGGPRTELRNNIVGGVDNSYHLWSRGGLGVDIAFDTFEDRTAGIAAFQRMDYEVLDHYEDGHIHVEPIG